MSFKRTPMGLALLVFSLLSSACDISAIIVKGAAKTTAKGSIALEGHWDYELATATMPNSIIQLEGMLVIVPDEPLIVTTLLRAYVGYTYAVVEDKAEIADVEGETDVADYHRERARYLYQRAKDLGIYLLALRADGMEEAMQGGVETFEAWLAKNFAKKEHAEQLLWAGYAWGNWINGSKDNMAAVADLPYVKAIVKRSVELDDTIFYGAGYLFMAIIATNEMGGDLDAAKVLWDKATAANERRALLPILNMGRFYAVKRGDRELFVRLMREVLEAPDTLPEGRLSNMISKRRAARYLAQVDDFFIPGGGDDDFDDEEEIDEASEDLD
jgi:hypothetical protein